MKKIRKRILYLIIVILVITISILIGIIINLSNTNNIINKREESQGQQLTEKTSSNTYVDMETHLSEINVKQQELENLQNTAGQATATVEQILKNYTAYKDGKLITGTMPNNGAVSATINAGESYTIPEGYHNGSGKITASSLSNQTSSKTLTAQFYADSNGSGNSVTLNFSSYFSEILGVRSITMGSGFYGVQNVSISGTKVTIYATHNGNAGYYPLGATVLGIPL